MALDLPTLVQKVRVDGDTKGAEDQVTSSMGRISQKAQKAGKAASLGLTVPIILGAYKATQAASDLSESASKVGVVFEAQAPFVKKFADSAATNLGISTQAALEATGTFGNLFRALGVGTKPAADMSTNLVQLASDLASFNNANPDDVLLALRSGLLGEAEPLRQFGVSLSAARIEAEALSSGLVKPIANATKVAEAALKVKDANAKAAEALKEHGKGSLEYQKATLAATKAEQDYAAATKGSVPELTAAQKAQAAYAIIQKDTVLAQGDFARTSGGLANQQRILSAQFKDASAQLGGLLLPVVTKVVKGVNGLLTGFKGLSPHAQKIVGIMAGLAAAAGPVLLITGKLASAVGSIQSIFSGASTAIGVMTTATEGATVAEGGLLVGLGPIALVVAAVAAAGFLLWKNWDKVAPVLNTVKDGAKQLFDVIFHGDFKGGGPFSEDSPIIGKVFDFRDALKDLAGTVKYVFDLIRNAFSNDDTFGFTGEDGLEGKALVAGKALRDLVNGAAAFAKNVVAFVGKAVDFLSTHVVPHVLEFGSKIVGALKAAFGFFKSDVVPIIADFAGFLIAKVGSLKEWWEKTWPQFSEAVGHVFRAVRTVIETILGILKPLIEGILGAIAALWRAWGDDILGFVQTAFGVVKEVISATLKIVQGIIQTVLAIINGDWGKAWDGIVKIVSGAFDGIFGILRGAINIVKGILGGIFSTFGEVFRPLGNLLHTWIVSPIEGIIDWISKAPGKIAKAASGMFDGIKAAFKAAVNWVIQKWNDLQFKIGGQKVFGVTLPGVTIDTPNIPLIGGDSSSTATPPTRVVRALGGRGTGPFFAGERGPELVDPAGGSAQVLNAERTQRLLRQIANGPGIAAEPGIHAPISVQTVDRPTGERLGRDIAWGLSSGLGRPLVGSGTGGAG